MKEEEPGNKLIQNSLSVDAQSVWWVSTSFSLTKLYSPADSCRFCWHNGW